MSNSAFVSLLCASLGMLSVGPAVADDQDESALSLADNTPTNVARANDWGAMLEGAFEGATQRDGSPAQRDRRLSLDVKYAKSFAPGWNAVLSDHLDIHWPAQVNEQHSINTIKEAYASWQPQADMILELGRINLRNGVATGYNPTDYFRAGALRSIISVDPAGLRENRQGSVMLRGQRLWQTGSITALYSPKLDDQASQGAFNPNLGATNHQDRWLLTASQTIDAGIHPQFLLFKEKNAPVQLGFNLTGLVNDSLLAHVEWSGGKNASSLALALRQSAWMYADDSAFRNRLATGLSFTSTSNFSLTAEYEYNGAGLDQNSWAALRSGPPAIYAQYRRRLLNDQELPTKQSFFVYGQWKNALIHHLDVNAMHRFDITDHSQLAWLEARYRWKNAELALQWQRYGGSTLSNYGAAQQTQSWKIALRHYL